MKQLNEQIIILKRLDFGEADRILTVLSRTGKKSMLAKGVRRPKSKLAGGLELFSTSTITYIDGKSDLKTIISTRLDIFFKHIISDYQRTMIGYELTKLVDKHLEHECDASYFDLLERSYQALNDNVADERLIYTWFLVHLLDTAGHGLQLDVSARGEALDPEANFEFSHEDMAFFEAPQAPYQANHIKFLRIVRRSSHPNQLERVGGWQDLIDASLSLMKQVQQYQR